MLIYSNVFWKMIKLAGGNATFIIAYEKNQPCIIAYQSHKKRCKCSCSNKHQDYCLYISYNLDITTYKDDKDRVARNMFTLSLVINSPFSFTNVSVFRHLFPWRTCDFCCLVPHMLRSLVTNSVEVLSSGVEIGSRFRCSIWMTIWNSLWRQETMQLGNLITISLVTAGAFTPSEHL